jgi:hypothetical protein
MTAGLEIYVIHISGKRMIGHGTNGLSRGNLTEGVMVGMNFLEFFPLEKTALEQSPELLETIRNWFPGEPLEVLHPAADWFEKGHDIRGWKRGCHLNYPIIESGAYLWQPAPAAGKFAVEELRRARLKSPCGALDTWDDSHCEPLVVAIIFPFLVHRPWQLRNTPKILAGGGKLHQM